MKDIAYGRHSSLTYNMACFIKFKHISETSFYDRLYNTQIMNFSFQFSSTLYQLWLKYSTLYQIKLKQHTLYQILVKKFKQKVIQRFLRKKGSLEN